MFGLIGALLFGTAYAGSAIKCGLKNKKEMSSPCCYLKNGMPVYRDRIGNTYINGEKTYDDYKVDFYGHSHWMTVGCKTGTIYEDSWINYLDELNKEMNKEIEKQKKEGYLAYVRYDYVRKKNLTCEIFTGRYIAKLEGKEDGTYWKYYLAPNTINLNDIVEGDCGVQITQEEYDKLNIFMGSHFASDLNRYTYNFRGGKFIYELRDKPLVAYDDLPKVPSKN